MEGWLGRALVAWVEAVSRRAVPIIVATTVLTLLIGAYAATHLGINTDNNAIVSADLDFWQDYHEFAEVFPILDEAMLVVVDAESASAAIDAVRLLEERLAEQPDVFTDMYAPGSDEFFQRHALLYLSTEELQDLSDHLATVQPLLAEISRDSSLDNLATVLVDGIERLRTDPSVPVEFTLVFDSLSRAVMAVLEGRPKPISWSELILERKLPGDSPRRVLVVHPVYDFNQLLPGLATMRQIRAAVEDLGLTPENGITVRITGNVALNTEEMVTIATSILRGVAVSLLLVGGILFLAMRSVYMVLAILITLIIGLVWTAGVAAWAIGYVNVFSASFAILFIGLGVDFGIHFSMRYAELRREGESHDPALRDTSTTVGGSLVLCAATTAMGFFVFVPTDFTGVAQLGLVSGIGMIISLLASLTVLPALLTLWKDKDPGDPWSGSEWFERVLITASSHHPRSVRIGAAALALASLLLLPQVRFDHNIANIRDPGTESVQTLNELLEESETSPWTMDLMAPSLAEADAMARQLRELDVVERAITISDYIPDDQQERFEILEELVFFVPDPPRPGRLAPAIALESQLATLRALERSMRAPWLAEGDELRAHSARRAAENLARFLRRLESIEAKQEELERFEHTLLGTLPETLLTLWNALEPDEVTLDSLPQPLVERMLAPDGRARVQILPAYDLADNVAHTRFVDTVVAEIPEATGSALTLVEIARVVIRSFQQALATAVIAVALLLWILWRRPGDVFLALTPLILAALLTVATAILIGLPFNFANVIVLPLLLGIGVDSGIHLVHRHRVAIEAGERVSPERELLTTSTAQAVFFSALTTMGSFGSLAFSNHMGLSSLGTLLMIGVTWTLLANLVVLPALIAGRGGGPAPR
ncbi:MAG: hypothetical protein E2O66_03475 [Deltaproteobacteria bacterium]|nr:MAG: hypothetical protein E2O66_03475 [Deltaproteobacteria bacterium]